MTRDWGEGEGFSFGFYILLFWITHNTWNTLAIGSLHRMCMFLVTMKTKRKRKYKWRKRNKNKLIQQTCFTAILKYVNFDIAAITKPSIYVCALYTKKKSVQYYIFSFGRFGDHTFTVREPNDFFNFNLLLKNRIIQWENYNEKENFNLVGGLLYVNVIY